MISIVKLADFLHVRWKKCNFFTGCHINMRLFTNHLTFARNGVRPESKKKKERCPNIESLFSKLKLKIENGKL